jgi:hypothetical protein
MPRHQLSNEDRRRGGQNRYEKASAEEWVEMSRKGFRTTLERHPTYWYGLSQKVSGYQPKGPKHGR